LRQVWKVEKAAKAARTAQSGTRLENRTRGPNDSGRNKRARG
jgi:hypothetical protein